MIEVAVIAATLVGGLAALWFFRDKIVGWLRRTRAKQTLPQWAPGRWRSDGGTNKLVITNDLNWTWESTFQGHWYGNGRGEVRDGFLVLRGSSEGTNTRGQPVPRRPTSFQLKRESEMLSGKLQTSYMYDVLFVRDE